MELDSSNASSQTSLRTCACQQGRPYPPFHDPPHLDRLRHLPLCLVAQSLDGMATKLLESLQPKPLPPQTHRLWPCIQGAPGEVHLPVLLGHIRVVP